MKRLLVIQKSQDDTSLSSLIFELYENQTMANQRQEFIDLNYPELTVICHEITESENVFQELMLKPNIDFMNMESVTYLNQEPNQ